MSEVVLHQYAVSPFCDKVRRILRIKRVPFRVREVSVARSRVEVPRLNRAGRLPVLEIEGRRIADSTEIAYELERLHPQPALIPEDPDERARCHVLEDWADESLYFYEMTMRFLWRGNARRWVAETVHSDPAWARFLAPVAVPLAIRMRAVPQGIGKRSRTQIMAEVNRHLEAVGALVGSGGWLVGDSISLADVAVASQLTAITGAEEGAAALTAHPAVGDWLASVDSLTLDGTPPASRERLP